MICSKEKCFGCGACVVKCPFNCISMMTDEYGFDYPRIDAAKCVGCNSCRNVCPANDSIVLNVPFKAYAAWIKDKKSHMTSSSGGIADGLAKTVVSQDGIVFGAKLNEDLTVSHCSADNMTKIETFKGSKYVQSRIIETYRDVKHYLDQGRKVLYIGTPCQVAAIKKYIGDNTNLYTVDIICHGTPSSQMLHKHIETIEKKYNRKATRVSFRTNSSWNLILCDNKGMFYNKDSMTDLWYVGFLRRLFYREACYSCPFANPNRVSDITIGDFWGLENHTIEQEAKYGVSVVLVNSEQGKKLIKETTDLLQMIERDIQEAINGNKQLRYPSKKHRNRKLFLKLFIRYGFDKAAKRALWLDRLINFVMKL